jgi:hypothetical protein
MHTAKKERKNTEKKNPATTIYSLHECTKHDQNNNRNPSFVKATSPRIKPCIALIFDHRFSARKKVRAHKTIPPTRS